MAEIEEQRLVSANGERLYVEPRAVYAHPDGNVLIVGGHNFRTRRLDDGSAEAEQLDQVIGAVVARDGTVWLVRSEIPSRLVRGFRALPIEDGWTVLFGELGVGDEVSGEDAAARLWDGVISARGAISLSEVPLPTNVPSLRVGNGSHLIPSDNGFTVAIPLRTEGLEDGILLLEKSHGSWRQRFLAIGWVEDVALDQSSDDVLSLAAITARAAPGEQDANSLFLFTEADGWRPRRVTQGVTRPSTMPTFYRVGGAPVLGWRTTSSEGGSWHLLPDVRDERGSETVVVPFAGRVAPLYVGDDGEERGLWMIEGQRPGYLSAVSLEPEGAGTSQEVGSIRLPFTHSIFRMDATSEGAFVLAGLSWQTLPARPGDPRTDLGRGYPESIVIRGRVACR